MADTRLVELNMSPTAVAVLEVDRIISRLDAEQIKAEWFRHTGRACVVLSGVHVAGIVDDDPGTPIFDKLVASRRFHGIPAIDRLAFGR